MRQHRLNLKKTIEAACFLLEREPGCRMNYMRMLKVLYLADRESIQRFHSPLTRDRVVAMDRGPVLSTVLDLIKGSHLWAPHWEKFIRKDGYCIEMVREPGRGSLSAAELDLLGEIADRHVFDDEWAMVVETHKLPEWISHKPPLGGCEEIPLSDILKAVGLENAASGIQSEIMASSEFDEFLSKVS